MDFKEIVGQDEAKKLLNLVIRNFSDILLVGPPGSGKTMLAMNYLTHIGQYTILQNEPIVTNGSQNIHYIVAIIKENIGKPILIDEAHKLKHAELLYEFLYAGYQGKGRVDTMIDKVLGRGSVFAFSTTDEGKLPDALASRLVKVVMKPYSIEELSDIASKESNFKQSILKMIAAMSHGSPRRTKMLCDILHSTVIKDEDELLTILGSLGYPFGLDYREIKFLSLLKRGPASISTLSRMMGTGIQTAKSIESELIASGLVSITGKGRFMTKAGRVLLAAIEDFQKKGK